MTQKARLLMLVLVVVVAFGFGLVAGRMTNRQSTDQREETVQVLMARQYITPWTQIRKPEELFKSVCCCKEDAPKDVVTDLQELSGMVVTKALVEDQLVKRKDLVQSSPKKDVSHLSPSLPGPKGMVALSIRADVVEIPAVDAALSGTHVDVISYRPSPDGKIESRVILQRVLVWVVDVGGGRPADKNSKPFATVTLGVTPEQFATLAKSDKDLVRLVLRKPEEERTSVDAQQ